MGHNTNIIAAVLRRAADIAPATYPTLSGRPTVVVAIAVAAGRLAPTDVDACEIAGECLTALAQHLRYGSEPVRALTRWSDIRPISEIVMQLEHAADDIESGQAVVPPSVPPVTDTMPVPVDLTDETDDETDDRPRFYRIPTPSGGAVLARFAGEGTPVTVEISRPRAAVGRVEVSREESWGVWAVLNDALMTVEDAVPTWAHAPIVPTDEHGRPLPDPVSGPF
ncbi:hypothetical protein [Microtetraspora niveoalba]|uniref:hypothetical protein n=1 Tax=Microtetraspora niveoalba TaxID=46175 RepID=UPI0008342749|nr:hypothetical protein [Microtetraspora niveoalba]